ncbi:TetR/AcrR family transcriptional regulator [Actinocorallia longicatena]|uniref:TetR/AcrR family transcriptional regulator n=1 Tax=Actinocorallia longicatena TaxID=111803 RepID=A0ABP6QN78_9ACTN
MATDSRQRIELAACDLLSRHGYHGLGLKALSRESELPYGSIYHHFPGGKEEIAAAAIEACGDLVAGMIRSRTPDASRFGRDLFSFMARRLSGSGWADGCPVGTPALDGAADSELVREACARAFAAMTEAVAGLLVALELPADRAADLATTIVAAYEGAAMLARVQRSDAPLRTVGEAMAGLVRQALP